MGCDRSVLELEYHSSFAHFYLCIQTNERRRNVVVSTSACHAGGRGSHPGPGALLGSKNLALNIREDWTASWFVLIDDRLQIKPIPNTDMVYLHEVSSINKYIDCLYVTNLTFRCITFI